ncbi:AAA family ATPase [[Actinomadura] parvosata]|nr:ATP-binding protein [Nonomuraea sp. ATCC 55076]
MDRHDDLAVQEIPGQTGRYALPAVGVFGPNASGKSNLLDALKYMCWAVRNSHQKWNPDGPISRRPFLLDDDGPARPSEYEVDIVAEGVRYNYGFSLDDMCVREEWLYAYPEKRRRMLFERTRGEPMRFGPTLTGQRKVTERAVRDNSLFLSAAYANNLESIRPIYRWFSRRCRSANTANEQARLGTSLHLLEKHDSKAVLDLLNFADLGVVGMSIKKLEMSKEDREKFYRVLQALEIDDTGVNLDSVSREVEIQHRTATGPKSLDFNSESTGTRTWLSMLGPILVTLGTGSLLVVDELDARLHPSLTAELVRLFQDPAINTKGGQLLFNSHDVTLLGGKAQFRLHRDQIWFTEKDETGGTRVYPLTEYRVREGLDNIERSYLRGRYGATPFFDETILLELIQAGDIEHASGQ